MLYVMMAEDRENSEAARQHHRDGHLAHFAASKNRIALAGPLGDDPIIASINSVNFDPQKFVRAAISVRKADNIRNAFEVLSHDITA